MKKLILISVMMFSLVANAGMKAGVGLENYEAIKQSTQVCQTGWSNETTQHSTCSGYVDKVRTNAIRGTVGYEQVLTDKVGAELNLGLNSLFNGQVEMNGLYKVSDKVSVKAGLNLSKDLNNNALKNVQAGLGYQIGVDYKLNDKTSLVGTVGTKSQSYEMKYFPGVVNDSSVSGNIGVQFRF